MSRDSLLKEARANSYKPEILEKVYRLISVLDQFMSVPYLHDRLALKGGTALNLFYFDGIPRLSVDIDFNYIGQIEREKMLQERPIMNDAINQILLQNQFELDRSPTHHAGGKMVWRYPSVLGQKGNLEIDLNYMYRQPLWPVKKLMPKIMREKTVEIPVLDIHELAAGKLSALFSRTASRDLFDAHYLLTKCSIDQQKLRTSFTIYLAMTEIALPNLDQNYIEYNLMDIRNRLFPVLRQEALPRSQSDLKQWANDTLGELHAALSMLLPLKKEEIEFITLIREHGIIRPELITEDKHLTSVVEKHPAIAWMAKKVDRVDSDESSHNLRE
jgi:predicted nucleotidyltransferase component of viral defense system